MSIFDEKIRREHKASGSCSASLSGGNQVDGLPLAPVRNRNWASWNLLNERTYLVTELQIFKSVTFKRAHFKICYFYDQVQCVC